MFGNGGICCIGQAGFPEASCASQDRHFVVSYDGEKSVDSDLLNIIPREDCADGGSNEFASARWD